MATSEGSNTEFSDPLENYDAPVFDDPIQQALNDEPVSSIHSQPLTCVEADATVRDTMALMVGRQIACVLVQEGDRLVGVFSDRDVLDRVALEYDAVIDGPVKNVMSTDPVFVNEHDSAARVLSVMSISGYRHVPVVNADHKAVGIVSPQRMAGFLHVHFDA